MYLQPYQQRKSDMDGENPFPNTSSDKPDYSKIKKNPGDGEGEDRGHGHAS